MANNFILVVLNFGIQKEHPNPILLVGQPDSVILNTIKIKIIKHIIINNFCIASYKLSI